MIITIDDNYIYLPFSYALKNFKEAKRPNRKKLPKMNLKFKGKLRPLQKEIKDKALKKINKNGSIIISLYCTSSLTIYPYPNFLQRGGY